VFDPAKVSLTARDFASWNQMTWYALFAASVAARFPETLRHLRVLPVGTVRLHATLLAWPALFWTAAWMCLAAVHAGVTGAHGFATFRLDFFFFLCTLTALAQALVLRIQNKWVRGFCGMPVAVPLTWLAANGPSWWLVTASIPVLGAAIAINANALAHSATYRRVSMVAARTGSI